MIAKLVREAFSWLEGEGFRLVGEEDHLPYYSISTFERRPVAVLIHWDGRDRAIWTVLARDSRRLRGLPGHQLGLSHLDSGGPPAVLLPDPAIDPEPLRIALEWDARLLRERGAALLKGQREPWADLAHLQDLHTREATR